MTALETLGLLVGVLTVAVALVWTAHLKPPAMVTAAVSLFSLALLGAWVADPLRADNLIPLMGVGLGGLVAALTSIFDPDVRQRDRDKPEPDTEEEQDHGP